MDRAAAIANAIAKCHVAERIKGEPPGYAPLCQKVYLTQGLCVLPSLTWDNAISSKGGRGQRRNSVAEQEPGAAQKAKGLAKEAAGAVMGDEEMKSEGRAEREGTEGHAEREGTEGHKEYFRKIIEETNRRASGKG